MVRRGKIPTSADVKRDAERTYARYLPKTMLRTMGIGNKPTYFFVYGITEGGKQVYWGPIPRDEADACAVGLIMGEVFEMDIKDLRKATQAIKAELLKRGQNPDMVLSRMSHTGFQEFLDNVRRKVTQPN
jgi:hypothetical protein